LVIQTKNLLRRFSAKEFVVDCFLVLPFSFS
jgi:hypothetical protein